MKNIFLFCMFIFASVSSFSQQLERQVISPAGGTSSNANASLSWTIGESMTETRKADSVIITEGFQQPTIEITDIKINIPEKIKISAWPNPTTGILNVQITASSERYEMSVTDVAGRTLLTKQIESTEGPETIDISHFSDGTYFLKIVKLSSLDLNIYKIEKIGR